MTEKIISRGIQSSNFVTACSFAIYTFTSSIHTFNSLADGVESPHSQSNGWIAASKLFEG